MKLGLLIDLDTCVGCHACAVACKEWNGSSAMAGGAPDYDPHGKAPSGVWFNRIRQYEMVPASEAPRPASEAPQPASEAPRPASEAPQPASEAPQPASEAPRPASEAPRPSVESLAPSALMPSVVNAGADAHWNLSKTINVPMSCMHCEEAACVTVCPTGASYKRAEDGIVLVDPEKCMGCNYCAWACPYGARELDEQQGVMRKCTLCVDRIYDEALPEVERQPACVLACPAHARFFGDYDDPESVVAQHAKGREQVGLLEDLGYQPLNRYLAPRQVPRIDISKVAAQRQSLRERVSTLVNKLVSL